MQRQALTSGPAPLGCCLLQTANGAVACQLMDALYPGVVPIKKV